MTNEEREKIFNRAIVFIEYTIDHALVQAFEEITEDSYAKYKQVQLKYMIALIDPKLSEAQVNKVRQQLEQAYTEMA